MFKKALSLMLVSGLMVGSGAQASTATNVATIALPLVAGGIAIKAEKWTNSELFGNIAKAGAGLAFAASINLQKSDSEMWPGFFVDGTKCVLLLLTTLIANNKTVVDALGAARDEFGGIGNLLTDKPGIVGFGTVARNVLVYTLLKEAATFFTLLPKDESAFASKTSEDHKLSPSK